MERTALHFFRFHWIYGQIKWYSHSKGAISYSYSYLSIISSTSYYSVNCSQKFVFKSSLTDYVFFQSSLRSLPLPHFSSRFPTISPLPLIAQMKGMFCAPPQSFLLVVLVMSMIGYSSGLIPSVGSVTATEARSAFQPEDYVIKLSKGRAFYTRNFITRVAAVKNFPILGSVDVQTTITNSTVRPQKSLDVHYHPRGSEYLYLISGSLNVSIRTDGVGASNVFINVKESEATVFPQGLIHTFKCISVQKCTLVTMFNTADPGLVQVQSPFWSRSLE